MIIIRLNEKKSTMKETLGQIITECSKRNIPFKIKHLGGRKAAFEISGFFKSKKAILYILKNSVICETGNQNIIEIDNFHEFAFEMLEWYLSSKNETSFEELEPFWAECWVQKGMMNKHTKIFYTINH